jgi:hypothetical protein
MFFQAVGQGVKHVGVEYPDKDLSNPNREYNSLLYLGVR